MSAQDTKTQPPPSYEMQDRGTPEVPHNDAIQPQSYPAQPDAVYTEPKQATGVYQPAMPTQIYTATVPIHSLSRNPAPVDCPACGLRALTKVSFTTGNTTHVWALFLCWCICLGCIPYLVDSTKNIEHRCGHCGVLLATWHRSGSLEVHHQNMVQQRT